MWRSTRRDMRATQLLQKRRRVGPNVGRRQLLRLQDTVVIETPAGTVLLYSDVIEARCFEMPLRHGALLWPSESGSGGKRRLCGREDGSLQVLHPGPMNFIPSAVLSPWTKGRIRPRPATWAWRA
jgi:hypothetical protein